MGRKLRSPPPQAKSQLMPLADADLKIKEGKNISTIKRQEYWIVPLKNYINGSGHQPATEKDTISEEQLLRMKNKEKNPAWQVND